MRKSIILVISVLASGTLVGCSSNKKTAKATSSSSSSKPSVTELKLLGSMKSNSKGVYNLRGKTNAKAKVWYHYKVGPKTLKDSFHANKSGDFNIKVVNTSYTQKTATIEVNVKAPGKQSNFDLASIKNRSAQYASRASERYALNSSEKAALASSKSAKSAKQSSEDASISRLVDSESKEQDSSSSTKSSYSSRYKHVSLDDFIGDPESYDGKDIKTSGTVSYIQREPDNNTMDYVVLNNDDSSAATVTEIEVEDMHDHHVTEGDNITVKGGGLTKTVKLNGQTLRSDIIVDYISVN